MLFVKCIEGGILIKILELQKSLNDRNIIYFPHAGSISKTAHSMVSLIPQGFGFFVIEYGDDFLFIKNDFSNLAWKLGQTIREYLTSNTILIGASFGGYLAYKISQLYFMANHYSAHKLILISVQDINQLKFFISDSNFDILSFLQINHLDDPSLYKEIQDRVQKDINCLKSIEINNKIKISSDIYIFNGKTDFFCHSADTKSFWKERTLGNLRYTVFNGSHIPNLLNWKYIFSILFPKAPQ